LVEAALPDSVRLASTQPVLAPETAAHGDAIERVLDRAFGPGRFAKPSERVREFAPHLPALSRVALAGGAVLGVCRINEIAIGGHVAYFLGPLAVDPNAQHGGLGHLLMTEVIAACRAAGRGAAIVLMGEPSFFGAFGFVRIPAGQVTMPIPVEARRLQWLGFDEPTLARVTGVVSRPRAASRA
jgi:predicted N-acetyltransferase YhbS